MNKRNQSIGSTGARGPRFDHVVRKGLSKMRRCATHCKGRNKYS